MDEQFDIDAFLRSPAALELRNQFAGQQVWFGKPWPGVPDDRRRDVADRLVAAGVWRFQEVVRDEAMDQVDSERDAKGLYAEGYLTEPCEPDAPPDRGGGVYEWFDVRPAPSKWPPAQAYLWTVCREVWSTEERRVYPAEFATDIGRRLLDRLGYPKDAPSLSQSEANALRDRAFKLVDAAEGLVAENERLRALLADARWTTEPC